MEFHLCTTGTEMHLHRGIPCKGYSSQRLPPCFWQRGSLFSFFSSPSTLSLRVVVVVVGPGLAVAASPRAVVGIGIIVLCSRAVVLLLLLLLALVSHGGIGTTICKRVRRK